MCNDIITRIRDVWIYSPAYPRFMVGGDMRVPDNYDMWSAYETQQEMERARCPVCKDCGEPIMEDTCYLIGGELICENCMDEYLIATPVED